MFDIRQPIRDRHGKFDEKAAERYTRKVIEQFAESPEGHALDESIDDEVGGWVNLMLHYAFGYVGRPLPDVTTNDMKEILFELFPRKVVTEPETAPEIVAELRAFWQFLQRQYQLPAAASIVALLNAGTERRLRDELANPANYGMGKSFFTQGQKAGFDMNTTEGMKAYMAVYNAQLGGRGTPFLEMGEAKEDGLDSFRPLMGPGLPELWPSPLSNDDKAKKRKERKAHRQARKRNRRK